MLEFVLLLIAVVLLVLAALEVTTKRISLGWLGLALFVAVFLIKSWP